MRMNYVRMYKITYLLQHQLPNKAKKCVPPLKKHNTGNTFTFMELLPLSTIAKRPPTTEIVPQSQNQAFNTNKTALPVPF